MGEKTFRFAQIVLAALSAIGACIAFFLTGDRAVADIVRQQQHEQKLEFKKVLMNEKMVILKDACRVAGDIVGRVETRDTGLVRVINAFERLYWGEIGLIEDSVVVEAGKALRNGVLDFQKSSHEEEDINRLKRTVANFTSACKRSYTDDWTELLQ